MTEEKLSVKNAKKIINKISKLDYSDSTKLRADMTGVLKSVNENYGIFYDDLYLEMKDACETIITLLEHSRLNEAKKQIDYLTGLLKQELS